MTSRPTVGLSTFTDFIVAPSSAKIATVQRAVEQYSKPWHPALDFYHPWKEAFERGLMRGDLLARLESVAASARGPRVKNFLELNAGLQTFSGLAQTVPSNEPTRFWEHPLLDVRMRPLAELRRRVRGGQMFLYLKAPALSRDAANAVLRMLDSTCPGTQHVVLDVRRGLLLSRQRVSRHFDAWLDGEASSFAAMWGRFDGAAKAG